MAKFLPVLAAFLLLAGTGQACAQGAAVHGGAAPDFERRVDAAVEAILKADDTPSASIAIVRDGRIAYAKAYGLADVAHRTSATADTRYQIASVSKEFTAAAALLLQEEGKLRLDDPVSRWFPELTDAAHVTLRQLLTHTSGYSDYWPQDYVPAEFTRPTTPRAVMDRWGRAPLDFPPGDDWQYSNTGYLIAGQIVQAAAGEPLFAYLRRRIFQPLHMSVGDVDALSPATVPDAVGYERAALAPLRPAPPLGAGWAEGAFEMATTASDVARWDVSLLDRTLLKPDSYRQELDTAKLTNGRDTGYALGLFVSHPAGRTLIEHSGEGAGFLSENRIYPDDRAAVVVLVNTFSSSAHEDIADALSDLVLTPKGPEAQARRVFAALQAGQAPRNELSDECAGYFDAKTVADYARSLGPLGAPTAFKETGHSLRGGMDIYGYRVKAGGKALRVSVFVTKAGKVDQFLVYDAG